MTQQIYNTAGNVLFLPRSVSLVAGDHITLALTGGGQGGNNGAAGTASSGGGGGNAGKGGDYAELDNYTLLSTDVANGISVNVPTASGPWAGGGNATASNLFLAET
jgi:hypothetical protein